MKYSRIRLELEWGVYHSSWVEASPEGDENNRLLIEAASEMDSDDVLEFEDFDTDEGFFEFFNTFGKEIISITAESMEV